MEKLIFSLSIIIIGLLSGLLAKKLYVQKTGVTSSPKLINQLKLFAFWGVNPLVMVGAFWSINIVDAKMIALPFICPLVLAIGGVAGIMFGKMWKHDNKKIGSLYACSTFSNLGTIGGLIAFSFLGEEGFAIAAMYIIFEAFYNYLVGYPLCKWFAKDPNATNNKKLFDPTLILYIGGVIIGLALKFSGIERPNFYSTFNEIGIPFVSASLIFCLGFEMKIGKIKDYIKECIAVCSVKFIIMPIIAMGLAYILGLQNLGNELIMKSLLIMACVPSGFNAIIVPSFYKIDQDMCNSCWLATMCSMIVIVPLLFVMVNYVM